MAKKDITPVYETLALANNKKKDKKTKAGIPDISGVKQAKDWVDENEK